MPLAFVRRSVLAAVAVLGLVAGPMQAQDDVPVVAATADLQFAIEEIAAAFTATTGMRVRLSLGSTGNITRQIRAGAPFQIFMAADEQFICKRVLIPICTDQNSCAHSRVPIDVILLGMLTNLFQALQQ